MTKEEIAKILMDYRKKKHLTQKEMANLCKVSIYTYRDWERGYCIPKTDGLNKIKNVIEELIY